MFALAAPEAMAIPPPGTTWMVTSCSDANSGSGTTGTLRYAAAHAVSNDVIDMTGLVCGTISLQTGAITLAQNTITLKGPGMDKLAISGKYNGHIESDRIFTHTGNSVLHIRDLSINDGKLSGSSSFVQGGCLYSTGSIELIHTGVGGCSASVTGSGGAAEGGAIFAANGLTLAESVVSGNDVAGGAALGGGIFAGGYLFVRYSTISNNAAGSTASSSGTGGGVYFIGANADISSSTISGNTAGYDNGGLSIHGTATGAAVIMSSTLSGNVAGHMVGGLYVNTHMVAIDNSTIAFNTAVIGRTGTTPNFTYYAPGVALKANSVSGNMAVTLQSSLIANNTYGSTDTDLSGALTSPYTIAFSGNNNLVRVPAALAKVPPDTVTVSCPLLGPLRDNGGYTQTHALLSHSPGIDQGNNAVLFSYDQRSYPRVSGATADIGAYEVQQNDVIFNNGFDGCPALF
ncbi:hypothetical protein GCM10009105_35170 [Dokdonella soli]|uniref:Right-handed parallel beta-helix repeat-containing protein n=1 Tax=Dokdonella soli TaxID=529810 RepID=A0ABN1IXC1_9GAMM